MIGVHWTLDDACEVYRGQLAAGRDDDAGKGLEVDGWLVQGRTNRYSDLWTWSDDDWWEAPEIKRDEVWINEALARRLGVGIGDPITLRVQTPSHAPAEVGGDAIPERAVELALRVAGIVPASKLGDFHLDPRWNAPPNAFMNLPVLQDAVGLGRRANVLVTCGIQRHFGHGGTYKMRQRAHTMLRWLAWRTGSGLLISRVSKLEPDDAEEGDVATTAAAFRHALQRAVELADYQAELRPARDGAAVELVSVRRRCLDRPLVEAVLTLAPEAAWRDGAAAVVENEHGRQDRKRAGVTREADARGTETVAVAGPCAIGMDRAGEVRAIRFAVPAGETPETFAAALEEQILDRVDPQEMGLRFEPMRARLIWWRDPVVWLACAGVVLAGRRWRGRRERSEQEGTERTERGCRVAHQD